MDYTKPNKAQLITKRNNYEAKLAAFYTKKVVELKKRSNGK